VPERADRGGSRNESESRSGLNIILAVVDVEEREEFSCRGGGIAATSTGGGEGKHGSQS